MSSLLFVHCVVAKSACIIIHGTWACTQHWYQPSGNFFKSVQRTALELRLVDQVISFSWSGKLSYQDQLQAAQDLVDLISAYDYVIFIGHSHGVTVGILASMIFEEKNPNRVNSYKILKFYALGVPVDLTGQIYPNMQVIGKFYNIFSFADYVQPINGICGRCFSYHERIVNIALRVEQDHPSHSGLHHSIIGRELLKIEEYFASRNLGNFEKFEFGQPAEIIIYQESVPVYQVQYEQVNMLELDKKAQWMMSMALFRSLYHQDDQKA